MSPDSIIIKHLHGRETNILQAEEETVQIIKMGIFLCEEGEVDVEVDSQRYHLIPNSLIVYFTYSTLRILNKYGTVKGLLIGIDIDSIQPFLNQISNFNGLFRIKQQPHVQITDTQKEILKRYTYLISASLEKRKRTAMLSVQTTSLVEMLELQTQQLSQCMMVEIISCYSAFEHEIPVSNRKDEVLQNFLNELYHSYREHHEVKYYSDKQFLTSRYFSAIIRERSGKTPSEWIAAALLSEAKQLLNKTNMSIKEVSDRLMFPNQSYFGKWFKNLVGIGPLHFKNGYASETANSDKQFEDFVSVSLGHKR